MNKNAKNLIEVARSGKYPQARNQLRKGCAFCFLGLGCEVYRLSHPKTSWWKDEKFYVKGDPYGMTGSLPPLVRKWLGFRTENGHFTEAPVVCISKSLSGLNDRAWTFKQLADLIELEPKGLFVEAEI